MKPSTKKVFEFVSALFGSWVLGLFGLMLGISIGGNFGFLQFKGLVGYESGGIIFSLVGISLGAFLSLMLSLRFLKEKGSYGGAAGMGVLALMLNLILYDYNMSSWLMGIIWIIPAIFVIVGYHYRRIFEKREFI